MEGTQGIIAAVEIDDGFRLQRFGHQQQAHVEGRPLAILAARSTAASRSVLSGRADICSLLLALHSRKAEVDPRSNANAL